MNNDKKEKILIWLRDQIRKYGEIKYSKIIKLSERANISIPMIFNIMTKNGLMLKLNNDNDLKPSD